MREFHYGFSARKAAILAEFLGRPVFKHSQRMTFGLGDRVYVWGDTSAPALPPGVIVVRVEDGFIRSNGLGAAFAEPVSWTFDEQGLHHRGDIETNLERLIRHAPNFPDRAVRGAALGEQLRSLRITKYNVGTHEWHPSKAAIQAPRRVLVVGQVANDAALRSITTPVKSNMGLLRSVRERCPDAYIIYKRHPDVVAGLRDGNDEDAMHTADIVVTDASVDAVFPHVDEVHVMTSLTGFEALLRGKHVVCHGWPFYAGWGLTDDVYQHPKRGEARTLAQVLGAALVAYPRYRNPSTGKPCEPEESIEFLASAMKSQAAAPGAPAPSTLHLVAGRVLKFFKITDRKAG